MQSKVDITHISPEQQKILQKFLSDPLLRLNYLYHILDKDGITRRFVMNAEQRHLHDHAALRNLILKARQLGLSTYIALLNLDSCLFTPNFKAGIVDRTLKDASEKLEKIRYAFDHLDYIPENPTPLDLELAAVGKLIKQHFAPKANEKIFLAKEANFNNGSRITIGTTHRGGTLQRLHISELGTIARHDPIRAHEIISGSIPSVGKNCQIFMESTHEGGKYGVHYEQICSAMDNLALPPEELTPLHFRFHFYSWWQHPDYRLDGVLRETDEQKRYFAELEHQLHTTITKEQRIWYIAMEKTEGSRMKQEFPSTPEEALNPIEAGNIYSLQIDSLRARGEHKAEFEPIPHRPIFVSWDLGIGDYMSLWWIQPNGYGKWLILDNYTANGLPIDHYIDIIREHDARWGRCAANVMPHDSSKRDPHLNPYDQSVRDAGYTIIHVPRTQNLWASIDTTRTFLRSCIIHARCWEPTRTPEGNVYLAGMDALANYSSRPMGANGTLAVTPLHDINSHAADALRCFADAAQLGLISAELGNANRPRTLRTKPNFATSYLHRK